MPGFSVGDRVTVDLSQMPPPAPGIALAGVKAAAGVVTEVDDVAQLVTVKLNAAFAGMDTVKVPPDMVTAV
jgi:hypothetical protein